MNRLRIFIFISIISISGFTQNSDITHVSIDLSPEYILSTDSLQHVFTGNAIYHAQFKIVGLNNADTIYLEISSNVQGNETFSESYKVNYNVVDSIYTLDSSTESFLVSPYGYVYLTETTISWDVGSFLFTKLWVKDKSGSLSTVKTVQL